MRVTEKKTKIERLRGNLRAETITTVNNQTFEISTFKTRGFLVSNALPIKAAQNGSTEIISFDFNDLTNKKILLIKEECSRATEKAIKAQHFKALAVFDEMHEKGEIQPNTPEEVEIKDIIFLDGYGKCKGSEGNKYVVYEIEKTTFGTIYKTVELDTLTIHSHDHVKPYSEKFGIGMYFEKGYCFDGSQDDLNNLIIDSIKNEKDLKVKKAEEEKKKAELLKVETENLLKTYNYLTPVKAAENEEQQTKKNVLTELKRAFPGVKFSMKKSDWRSYRLSWTDGPTRKEIENLLNKYIGYSSSECGDYYDPNRSLFNDVFGYFKFFFFDREMSKEIETLKEEFNKDINNRENYVFSKIFQNTSIPVGANTFKIEEGDSWNPKTESFFRLVYNTFVAATKEALGSADIEVIDYSPKAIAIIGDTKAYKDELKSLGGRFNFKLKCGAGWIFPKSKEALIKKRFNL